jgi:cytochrome b involved in lipid metabolism
MKAEIGATEVATHASREDCWSIINGNVYDLTSWIPKHPGGEQAILQLCGSDGSAKFGGQHGGAPKQAAILAGFKIGVAAP